MKSKNIRWWIVSVVTLFYLVFAIKIRPMAYAENWHNGLQIFFGCLPNLIAVIGLTSLFNIFIQKEKHLKSIFYVGIAVLLYEITGGFGRKSGIGITFDYLDIVATFVGMIVSYFIEKSFLKKNEL